MRRLPSVWYELLNEKHGPVDDRVEPCWLNHAPVSTEQEHMLLNCAEAERLRKAVELRGILAEPAEKTPAPAIPRLAGKPPPCSVAAAVVEL